MIIGTLVKYQTTFVSYQINDVLISVAFFQHFDCDGSPVGICRNNPAERTLAQDFSDDETVPIKLPFRIRLISVLDGAVVDGAAVAFPAATHRWRNASLLDGDVGRQKRRFFGSF